MPARAASSSDASTGISRDDASAKSLRMAKWMCGSMLPSATTSRCSSRASTPATLVSIVGTITIVRDSSGTPVSERSRRDSRCGRIARAIRRWINAIATSLAGISISRTAAIWTIADPC